MSREPYLMAPPSAKLDAPSLSRNTASSLLLLLLAELVEAVGGDSGEPGRVSPSPLLHIRNCLLSTCMHGCKRAPQTLLLAKQAAIWVSKLLEWRAQAVVAVEMWSIV